ncbi:MAG TPA: asparagine synthase (glutamine-hydrolyzing) [Myxococcales bacterium]|nr:asparagine synthase (glutamine-hydrolyzing) [Myxococcales bacterium]
MCGIAGYAGLHDPELLRPMTDAMIHRGPDDSGTWYDADAEIGFGHRRLAIIDLSPAGRQPMSNADESIFITYNGELYNYLEHRERLAKKGYPFRSNSDTEVMIALYETMGIDFLNELNGIFAFALWDAKKRRLILARDHAGVKPLYYRQDGRKLYFASELKALLKVPGSSRELHTPSVPDYLTFLWVPGENTLLSGIKKLEPGHFAIWEDGQLETKRWFNIEYEPDESRTEAQWNEEVHDSFMNATKRQMVSDVPLGAFLSGGLDSSSIVACMRNVYPDREINTYTVRFDRGAMAREQGVDDYPYARKVAKAIGVRLKSVMLQPEVISLLPKMVYHLDEPDADPAVFPSYLISKLAREDGTTVLLSGTGGDEVFFGYRSHQAYRLYERFAWMSRFPISSMTRAGVKMSSSLLGAQNRYARRIAKFRRGLMQSGLDRHLEVADWSSHAAREGLFNDSVFDSMDSWDSSESMRRYHDDFVGEGELNLHSHLLIQTFLAAHNFLYTDKSSMAVGLEARVPFMDVELMRLCARIPERYKLKGNVTKNVLKNAMGRYLPRDLIHRKKTGFGAPLRKWIQDDLQEVIQFFLGPEQVSRRGIFNPDQVQRIVKENTAGRADHAYLIYALVNLELWMQSFLDAPGEEVTL